MAGQRGRDILLKIADGESYVTLAGIRASRIELRAGAVDATAADSPDAWRELLGGAGTKSARISGRGVLRDAASDARLRAAYLTAEIPDWELVLAGTGRLTGPFQITELSYSGPHDGEADFSVTLESAGALAFEATP